MRAKERARKEFWFLPPEERYRARKMLINEYGGRRRYTTSDGEMKYPLSRRMRQLFIFVMESRASGQVVGCSSISVARPEAALPPPFPTGKPFRCYASNIAVEERYRRQGIGRRLLQQCERVATLWGEESIWLHADANNLAALKLYESQGYSRVDYLALYGNGRTLLLNKNICQQPPEPPTPSQPMGRRVGNVFLWD